MNRDTRIIIAAFAVGFVIVMVGTIVGLDARVQKLERVVNALAQR